MRRSTEITIALVASMALGPLCGWLGTKVVSLFDVENPVIGSNGTITCPLDANVIQELDSSVDTPGVGIADRGTICVFK